jgi:hypothetical protein
MRVPEIVSPRSVRMIVACSLDAKVIAAASGKLTLCYRVDNQTVVILCFTIESRQISIPAIQYPSPLNNSC